MLQSLYIKNYALIDELMIRFHAGFSVITGETGAGKSILVGALGLLLGQRADSKIVTHKNEKCIVEGQFCIQETDLSDFFQHNDLDYDPKSCIIRREILPSGKSRAFVNDTPTNLSVIKELGDRVVDVHSQHQNLLLNTEGFQLNVLDIIAHNEQLTTRYKAHYEAYKQATKALQTAIGQAQSDKAEEDYLRYQLNQLEQANLQPDEQEALEEESQRLNHAEEIKSTLYAMTNQLDQDEVGTLMQLETVAREAESLKAYYSDAEKWIERIESCRIELQDLSAEMGNILEQTEVNPDRKQEVTDRLNLIYSLQQKHQVASVGELIELRDRYAAKVQSIDTSGEAIAALQKAQGAALQAVTDAAARLHDTRLKAARTVEAEMKKLLIPLGMPHVRFAVEIETSDRPDERGIDKVTFLFSANKSMPMQNIAQVASGGEIARIMLCIKAMIAGAVKLPTILFDEIDTGVSGKIAERMAEMMFDMAASERQVISISHLPQIAAKGTHHYLVYKTEDADATRTHIDELTPQQRVEEIARMLSGSNLTQAALDNARELLSATPRGEA